MRGFISYARKDRKLLERFRKELDVRLDIDRSLSFSVWWDSDVLLGERWDERIRAAMAAADFSLLMVSPAFLSSPYVTSIEIPALLNHPSAPVMPVGLQHVDFDRSDLQGLAPFQIFLFQPPGADEPRWFADLAGQNTARFCDELARQISSRLLPPPTAP